MDKLLNYLQYKEEVKKEDGTKEVKKQLKSILENIFENTQLIDYSYLK